MISPANTMEATLGGSYEITTRQSKTAPQKGGWEGEDGSRDWQAPSSGEVGGCRSGAETRLTGIGSGATPETADANVTSTGLPGPRIKVFWLGLE